MSGYDPTMEVRTRPVSVIVLSIIGLLWAAMAVLCVPLSFIQFVVPLPPPQDAIAADTRADSLLFGATVIGNVVIFFLGLLLLIGCIGSLMLKKFAWMMMVVYALLSIITGLVWTFVTFTIIMPKTNAIMQKHGLPAMDWMFYIGIAFGALALIYQISVLVFYNTPKVKRAFGK